MKMKQAVPSAVAVLVLAGLAAIPATAPLFAAGLREAPIVIHEAWARETPGGATSSAAYFVIENRGDSNDALIEASTPIAGRVELHTVERQGDVMRMRRVFAIDAPAGGRAVLEQGGLHVMLIDLRQPLIPGESFPLTLLFDSAAELVVDVEVRPLRE